MAGRSGTAAKATEPCLGGVASMKILPLHRGTVQLARQGAEVAGFACRQTGCRAAASAQGNVAVQKPTPPQ